jgi:hypothetical protein
MNYLELFARTRAIIKHHLVFSDNGIVEPLPSPGVPTPKYSIPEMHFAEIEKRPP